MSYEDVRRKAWDDAVLTLIVEDDALRRALGEDLGLGGAELLARVVNEANDALARLSEQGLIGAHDEDEDDDA